MNEKTILYVLFGFVIFGGGGVVYMKARGLRNNNAGNVRHGANWQGMQKVQTDKSFIQFVAPVYGLRAINKILKTYSTKYGINTVRGVIERWAPPIENDTESYVYSVADRLGLTPNQKIDIHDYAFQFTQAIVKHENGLQPYSDQLIKTGVAMGWA